MKDNTDTSFRFFAFGDSGSADGNQAAVADRIAKNLSPRPDFGIHTGDIVYAKSGAFWDDGSCEGYPPTVFQPYQKLLKEIFLWPSLGNHDSDPYPMSNLAPYVNIWSLPLNGPIRNTAGNDITKRNYWFDYGNARFIAIDSNASAADLALTGPIGRWLNARLAGAGNRWKFIFFHHSPYGTGPHGSTSTDPGRTIRQHIVPIIEAWASPPANDGNGLDGRDTFVFSGHDHVFELLILNDPNPTYKKKAVYIVTGAGGNTLYPECCSTPIDPDCVDGNGNTVQAETPLCNAGNVTGGRRIFYGCNTTLGRFCGDVNFAFVDISTGGGTSRLTLRQITGGNKQVIDPPITFSRRFP